LVCPYKPTTSANHAQSDTAQVRERERREKKMKFSSFIIKVLAVELLFAASAVSEDFDFFYFVQQVSFSTSKSFSHI